MGNEVIVLPHDYIGKSKEELKYLAKRMYDRTVSVMFYSKEINSDFEADENTMRMVIDYYIYAMCCVDGNINQSELDFMIFLNADMSSENYQEAMKPQLNKDDFEFLKNIITNFGMPEIVRDIIRISTIAAVSDTNMLNARESGLLEELLYYAGF